MFFVLKLIVYYEEALRRTFSEPTDVVVVVLSQKEGYHAAHADHLRKRIYEQASALEKVCHIVTESLSLRFIENMIPYVTCIHCDILFML